MNKIKSKAVKVKIKHTEKVRKELIERNLLRTSLKILKRGEYAFLPVNDKINFSLENFDITEAYFCRNKSKTGSYKESVKIPKNIKKYLPSSFDVIGNILFIKLNDKLLDYKQNIGKAILDSHKNISSVYLVESVSGEFRTRDLELIAGKPETRTVHREFGINLLVDIKNVYFSPRLANERKRVADLVNKKEIVLDMFTGVAPFSIMIAKYSKPEIIFAVDKNKSAIELAKKNIRLNKVYENIKLICGDSKNIKNLINPKRADRIIMNLPFSSYSFFEYALGLVKDVTIIHYYDILVEENIDNRAIELKKMANSMGLKLSNFKINKIKSYSPREFYIGIDITAKKKFNADVA